MPAKKLIAKQPSKTTNVSLKLTQKRKAKAYLKKVESRTIIHISGAIGSGKTTLANKIQKKYKNSLVIDLDDFLNEYVKSNKFSVKGYQTFINDFIENNRDKNIIFLGINQDMGRSKTMYELKPNYKFFINLDIKENVKRRFIRDYKEEIDHFFLWKYISTEPSAKQIYEEWIKNEKFNTKRLQKIIEGLSPSALEKDIQRWHDKYKKLGYKFMTSDEIFTEVSQLLQ